MARLYDQRERHLFATGCPPARSDTSASWRRRGSTAPACSASISRSSIAACDFFQGAAELYDTAHLIRRLEGMPASLLERAEQAARDAEKSHGAVRDAIRTVLGARGVTCSEATLARLDACADPDVSGRRPGSALSVIYEYDLFATGGE